MRHMRSRRILAMLLALSMIFGLLTTTAFAGEVDQNTSNVGESAANGTSEGGSGEGQSSGASEDESSKVTNKEDVPTGEETIPEEKKTTSDEEVDTLEGEGENPTEETTYVASIGEQGYASLDAAIQAAQDNDTIVVSAGEYTLNGNLTYTNKAFTIKAADGETVSFDMSAAVALHGAKITFEGVTFNYKTNGNYIGLQHADTLVYDNCVINGMVFLYATNETFNNCKFNQTSADAYNVWTYGAKNVAFNSCTFNCVGKSVLVYNEGANAKTDLNVNDTKFNASAPVEGKAAIEIDTSLMTEGATITVDANTTADGFAAGSNSGSTLWNDKKQTADTNKNTTVTVANEAVFVPKSTGVATVGGVSYDKLEDAFAALSDKAYTLTLNDESAWDTATPVYWAAGDQKGYAATLAEALTAAYKAKADDITIICRPGADVGTMTHGHVADNITIYGNKAYISGGECDLEVDTYKFSRETGKQDNDKGDYLTDDITITAYELDNLGVWGQRNTGYTVNVNLTDCDTVQGITVQRVYISGETGVNNITLSGCDFGTKATSVYSNADGDINITNCSFTGAQVPVNFNHKTGGEQTLRVSNCEFNACGDAGEWKQFAAPVRFVNSGSGSQTASINACTFADTVGSNGDILIGDGRTGQNSNDVNLTITDTEANIQAQKPGYYKDDGTTDNALKGEKALTTGETLTVSKMEDLIGGSTGIKGSSAENAYTLDDLGAMTRSDYIAAQNALGGTMYVTVGNYSYDTVGVLGNGVRDDTPGQTPDHSKLNAYGENGYLDDKNDGANGKSIVFVNGSITSGVTGYETIDGITKITSLLLAVPAYTNVTFKGITFNNVMCFNYQLYTGPWSQLGELKFDGCTFKGIIVGAIAAQTLTFNGCTFTNFTNTTDANSSNPTWIRPAYGNWKESDNEGQGENFKSLTTINFTNNNVTSTRPVKFEFISQWNKTTTLTATGNSFDISAQDSDTETKNVGLYIGPHTDKNAVDLVLDKNTKSERTAALYVIPAGKSQLPVGSTVKDSSGTEIEITDALEWKTDTKVTLKTETVPAVKNVAKVGETEYATLEDAIAKAEAGQTVTLIADVNTPETTYVVSKDLTIDLNGKTVTGYGYDGVFQINGANANVLIKNGNVVAVEKTGSEGKYAMAVWACAENCEVTLEDLTVTQDITHTDDKQMDMIYTSKGTIIINSGSFTSGTPAWTLNCKDSAYKDGSAKIIVNGGTFVGFDPNVSPEQKVDGETPSFAAPGVGITKNEDGTFSAVKDMTAQLLDADGNSVKAYTSLAEAIAAAAAGQTVRLLADATEDVTINENITLDLGGKTLTNTGAGHATITIAKDATATVKNGSVVGGTSYYNIQNNGTATFEGLTATAGNNGSSMIDNYGTLTITSGTYTGGLNVVKSEEGSKLTINGGKFTLEYATSGYTGVIFAYGDTTITGGEFIQSLTTTGRWNHPQVIATGVVEGYTAITRVTGGTFTNKLSGEGIFRGVGKGTSDNFEVSGGTFNKSIPESFCADGFIPTKNADGTYGVKEGKYVATTGKNNFETLEKAVSLVAKNGKITLLADVDANIEIGSTKNFTLDLNGHTINGGTGTAKATITNYGTVTITDKSTAKTGTIKRDDNGTVGETSFYVIRNIGTMTIEQAIVTNNSGYKKTNPSGSMVGSSLICNGDDDLGGTLNISGGKFEQKNFIAIKNGALGKLNVTGGTISSDHSAIQNWFEATITGGEINGQLWTDAYIEGETVGHTTIGDNAKFTGEIVMDISGSVKPTLEISGGDLNVTNWRITTAAANAGAKPAVSGGKFTSAVPENYCADGYVPTKNEDGTYGVKVDDSVAEVGGVKYLSLQAAIDAAKSGATVKLLNDTKENVTISKKLTLDLNGKTLNGGQVKGTPALKVDNASVTIQDSSAAQTGTIMREDTAENSGKTSHYVIDVQGKYGFLKIEGGNIKNNSGVVNVSGKGASLIRLGNDSVSAWPTLTIKGGTFTQNNFIAIKVDRGTLHLLGGEINSANSYAIENWNNAYIKGGTVNGTVSSWVYSTGVAFSKLEISGGTVNGNVASVNYDSAADKQARIYITGGEVTGTLGTYTYSNRLVPTTETAMATVEVTGGTFDKDPTTYVVEGSTVNKNSEGKFGVEKAYLCKIGEKQYYTMDEAFHAVQAGETITMLRNYTTDKIQNSGSASFTIDLNGHTWTANIVDVNSAAFEINYSDVTLTVKNGKVISSQLVGLIPSAMSGTITYNSSGLVFEGVEATANGHSGIETNGNNTNDTVTLKDSTLNVPSGFGIYFPSSGKLTIENSQITAKTMGVQVCSGSLDIKGAETKIEVTGDGVEKTENDGAIQDGAAISIVNRAGYKGLGTITVTEGIFTAKSGNAAVKAYNWENKTASDFTASDKVAISGGSYSTVVPADLCAEGFVPVTTPNTDGLYEITKDTSEAKIGDTKYATLADALKVATSGNTIVLLNDVTHATGFVLNDGILIDLNGHNLTTPFIFTSIEGGAGVVDTSGTKNNGGIGTLKVQFKKSVMNCITVSGIANGNYLPVYAGAETTAEGTTWHSYKIYRAAVVTQTPSTAEDKVSFSFRVVFADKAAYTVMKNNPDQFIIRLDLVLENADLETAGSSVSTYFVFNQSYVNQWIDGNGGLFTVHFTGVSGYSGSTLNATASAKSAYTGATLESPQMSVTIQ